MTRGRKSRDVTLTCLTGEVCFHAVLMQTVSVTVTSLTALLCMVGRQAGVEWVHINQTILRAIITMSTTRHTHILPTLKWMSLKVLQAVAIPVMAMKNQMATQKPQFSRM